MNELCNGGLSPSFMYSQCTQTFKHILAQNTLNLEFTKVSHDIEKFWKM